MGLGKSLFTSESVTEGHPDKICDQISDAVLDAMLSQDKTARVACETCVTTGMALVMGEISTSAYVDIPKTVRSVIRDIGYDNATFGQGAASAFDANTCAVLTSIDEQSPDIAQGVDNALEGREENKHDIGAGDQGMMFGYACRETTELMPLPISLSHALAKKLASARKSGEIGYLLPDGKSQVTVEYDDNWQAKRVDTVVISTQHTDTVSLETIRKDVIEGIIRTTLPANLLDNDTRFFVNPTGRFVVGGPQGDSGLTGRKIIVDTYGGYARHGGGAFSGKDPTKVDRSAAYAARYIAKNIVAAGIADRAEVELAYAIGVAQPVSIFVETFGTGKVGSRKIADAIYDIFALRPAAILTMLDLRKPQYRALAAYGHMGREDLGVAWEKTDKADDLRRAVGL